MNYATLAVIFVVCLFFSIMLFFYLGSRYAAWHQKYREQQKVREQKNLQILHTAIFALLGLLIALTFANAAKNFNERRLLIIEEANNISTAYLRLDLLPNQEQLELKKNFREYLNLRINTYKVLPDEKKAYQIIEQYKSVQETIWKNAVQSCQKKSPQICMLVLPTLNTMFDIASTRVNFVDIHPHRFIFVFLVILTLITSFMVGYNSQQERQIELLHVICFALVFAFAIYSIVDLEYPRLGLIRVTQFDKVLYNIELKP